MTSNLDLTLEVPIFGVCVSSDLMSEDGFLFALAQDILISITYQVSYCCEDDWIDLPKDPTVLIPFHQEMSTLSISRFI